MTNSTRVTVDPLALSTLRQKDGHTLSSLARAAGYSVGYLNDLEKGRRRGNASVIRALADTLDVPFSMLVARTDERDVA